MAGAPLPLPAWTERPEYFLVEQWDYVRDIPEFPEALYDRVDERREQAHPIRGAGLLRL